MPLSETQRQLVELYARDPNPTRVAAELGVHRSTIHRRLDEPGVREAVAELRGELEPESKRNTRIEQAQDMALELLEIQLQAQLRNAHELSDKGEKVKASIADIQKLMQIAEKLSALKRGVGEDAKKALERAREARGEVDWNADVTEDD